MAGRVGAYLQLSAAMVIVGSTVVVSKLITGVLPVFVASALRFGVASLVLVPVLLRAEGRLPRLDRKGWLILFLQSFAGNFLFSVFLLYGLRLTSATASGILTSTTPALIGLIALIFLRERLAPLQGIGIVLAVVGIMVINVLGARSPVAQGANPLFGNVLILGAVVGEALWTILGKVATRQVSALAVASLASLFGFVMFLPFALLQITTFNLAAVPTSMWLHVVYYGLVGTVGAYVLWYSGVARVPTSVAGVFTGILPISAVAL